MADRGEHAAGGNERYMDDRREEYTASVSERPLFGAGEWQTVRPTLPHISEKYHFATLWH